MACPPGAVKPTQSQWQAGRGTGGIEATGEALHGLNYGGSCALGSKEMAELFRFASYPKGNVALPSCPR